MQFGDRLIGGRYKFDDFYSAFGTRRDPADPIALVNDLDRAIGDWRPVPNLAEVQAELLAAFPIQSRVSS